MDNNNTRLIITISIITAVVVGVVWFLVYKNKKGGTEGPKTLGEQISEQVKGPVSNLVETNPFKAETNPFNAETNPASSVNPFNDVYKNPFK